MLKELNEYKQVACSTESLVDMTLIREKDGVKTAEYVNSRLLHGAMGLVTEAGELKEAVFGIDNHDTVNLIEECGDVIWYLAITADTLDIDFTNVGVAVIKQQEIEDLIDFLSIQTSIVMDKVKRHVFYGKELERRDVLVSFTYILACLDDICRLSGGDVKKAIEKVTIKLTDKDKGRFKDGFSQEEAYDRDLDAERELLESE
jgi:NTP pyrophosphatase (non-canonical NTP hydrolase)